MIYAFFCDGNGYDSVADIVESNKQQLSVFDVPNYEVFDLKTTDLLGRIKKGDVVILDTISSLANTTRGDLKIGNDPTQSYWAKRDKFMGDSMNRNAYDAAGQLILRRLKDFKAVGANIIVTVHESEREDMTVVPPMKKRAPDVNAALMGNLIGSSSDVVRLYVNADPVLDGEGKVKYPARSRMLQLGPSDEFVSKVHVPLEMSGKVPQVIKRPSYPKLCKALGKTPTWVTVYGPPGAGKTTFALSMFLDPKGEGIGI
jgi:hypothetical protein